MQSSSKALEGLISKIQSPLCQIRNRAITTLYTKVSAKIITQIDLTRSKQLPGVLFNWINQTAPASKDCLFKVLTILHRYTLTQTGVDLLFQYQALQFLEELRKFLLLNQTNVDAHVDIIKKMVKYLLPLQNERVSQKDSLKQDLNQQAQDKSTLNQQRIQDSDSQEPSIHVQQSQNKAPKQRSKHQQPQKQRNIIQFICLNESLPKQIDQQLYALLIQLKHGNKKSILQTLVKIQQIVVFWGSRYFKYKEDLIRQLVTVIEGKVYSQICCKLLSVLLRQLLEMQQDMGLDCQADLRNCTRNYIKTAKITDRNLKMMVQKVEVQLKFQIFEDNPFVYAILETIITKNKAKTLSASLIQFLLVAVGKLKYSALFLPELLQKISNNTQWINERLSNKFFQEEIMVMINHACFIQPTIYFQVIPYLAKLFPDKTLQKLSKKIPNLSIQLQEQQIQQSFDVLTQYSSKVNQNFDFNLELHQLQTHINNLERGLPGIPKKPQVISLYVDCMLMLAISVAKQDPLMSFYPKIKSLIIKISEHEYLNCRVTLYDNFLLAFNSSDKVNYLAQSYLKSQIMRLTFSDSQFYTALFINSLNQSETISPFLEITKLIQTTTKEQNNKYLNKYAPVFYILSFHSQGNNSLLTASICSGAKIILSRMPKKYQIFNVLISMFSKVKEQRLNTYTNILGLSRNDDLIRMTTQYLSLPEKKCLKYSLSTIRNYMNIIMNQNIQNQIKSSAINQMIECVQRFDLSLLQKDQKLLSQIMGIHSSIQTYLKSYSQKSQQSSQNHLFIQLVRIYSILQKRLRLQTNNLNQSIKSLQPQLYLNILINICSVINQENLKSQKFQFVIPEFMILLHYHCFYTFTSKLLFAPISDQVRSENNNLLKVHWITNLFPHQNLIKQQVQQVNLIAKRVQLLSSQNISRNNKQKQNRIQTFLKGYKLKIKSIKQLLQLYIQNFTDSPSLGEETIKIKTSILCPILQRQLSNAIHNINQSQNQLSVLNFLIQSFAQNSSKYALFQPLQEMVPHLFNQLMKPNVPRHVKMMLINISNTIGWKRTKQFQGLLQQLSSGQLYYLKLIKKMHKISTEQLNKIVKIGLSNVENVNNFPYLCMLFQVLLKPSNLRVLISSSSQYTQLLVLNSLIKSLQHSVLDHKLVNFSSILLYQILNEIISQVKAVFPTNLVNTNDFDDQTPDNRIIELTKLVGSLSIGPNLISFILQQFQVNQHVSNYTLQGLCFMVQAIAITFKLSDFVAQNQIVHSDISLAHQSKMLKIFLIRISEFLRSESQYVKFSSMQNLYTSVLNLINSSIKTQSFNQTALQIQFLDMSLILLKQKVKVVSKKSPSGMNPIITQTYSLFCAIFEYNYLKVQSQPKQNSHYLLSSTGFLQSSIDLLVSIRERVGSANSKQSQMIKTCTREVLQKIGKVIYSVSLYQEDYFVFKLNQLCQEFTDNTDLFQTLGLLVHSGDQNFLVCFMRILSIWQGQKQAGNNPSQQAVNNPSQQHSNNPSQQPSNNPSQQGVNRQRYSKIKDILNPTQIYNDQEQQDDSSAQEGQLAQNPKKPIQSNWIYQMTQVIMQRNHLKHCKSLLALSLPAKMFIIENPAFMQYLKKMSHLIDNRIILESTTYKRKAPKKTTLNNTSNGLSNSRKTVISQAQSNLQSDQTKAQEQKLNSIQEFLRVLISLFTVDDSFLKTENIGFWSHKFSSYFNRCKDVLRKLFYNIDKLYTLSQVSISNPNPNKEFTNKFLKLINALSQSTIFSLPLDLFIITVASPMLQQSILTVLRGISSQLNQQEYQKLKQALRLLSTLANHDSVRSYIYKNKLIEELNLKIGKYEDKKTDKVDFINLNSLYDIVIFYLNLSKYKDSHPKILNDKKVLEVFINLVYMQKSSLLSEKIIQLLANLCAYKSNKAIFMQNREIHKTILGQLQSDQIEYKCHLLTLLYNLMYRHAPAVKLYKRKDVVQMLHLIHWQNCQNYDKVKHIRGALLQVLESQSQIPDKN